MAVGVFYCVFVRRFSLAAPVKKLLDAVFNKIY
jgi:hypothetical protein